MRPALSSAFRPALRQVVRRKQHGSARFASTESTQKKAQDALGSAQKVAEQAWAGAKRLLGPVGERAAGLLGSYREPLTYNLRVAGHILKQVYIAERLAPPTSVQAIKSAYLNLWANATNITYLRSIVTSGEWARVGVYALEAYGIFKVGEIVGRRSLVGYDLH